MRIPTIHAVLCALALALATTASAQDTDDGPVFVPVEIFLCHFEDGKGHADLDRWVDTFNNWVDGNEAAYTAWTYTPQFLSSEYLSFDFAWMGVWTDGKTMGAGMDAWLKTGGKEAAAFAKIAHCGTHANFASSNMRVPDYDEWPESAVVSFADCSITDPAKTNEAMAAVGEWAGYMDENGMPGAMWTFWPVYGTGSTEYDFKMVQSYRNYSELGTSYDMYGTGGAWRKAGALMAGLVDCGPGRVYDFKLRRTGVPPKPPA